VYPRKTYRYRMYPTAAQSARLQWVLDRCRELYNAALQECRDAYRMADCCARSSTGPGWPVPWPWRQWQNLTGFGCGRVKMTTVA